MKLSDSRIDSSKIEQGGWVDNIPDFGDIRLKVRGLGNTDYRRLQAKLVGAIPRAKRSDPEVQERMLPRLLAETILIDWENVEEGPYTKEMALKFLSDPDMRPFRDAVLYAASVVAERNAEEIAADVKN